VTYNSLTWPNDKITKYGPMTHSSNMGTVGP
jgi:hypothetical protein